MTVHCRCDDEASESGTLCGAHGMLSDDKSERWFREALVPHMPFRATREARRGHSGARPVGGSAGRAAPRG